MSAAEKCQRKCDFYRSLFPDVPYMTSADLTRLQLNQHAGGAGDFSLSDPLNGISSLILVDVRTEPERSVSMIVGAISLRKFEREVVSVLSPDATVVTYCTIGYRSGLEARRIRDRYNLRGRVRHLDGILAYTHALEPLLGGEGAQETSASGSTPELVDPETNEKADQVHTFGPLWVCANESYHATYFSPPVLAARTLQTGCISTVRAAQLLIHKLCSCIC